MEKRNELTLRLEEVNNSKAFEKEKKAKDIEQQLNELNLKNKENQIIFDFQDTICAQITDCSKREAEDLLETCETLVQIILPGKEEEQETDFRENSYEGFLEAIGMGNTIYLYNIDGLRTENITEVIQEYGLDKALRGINLRSLNALHWVIVSQRFDIFNFLMDSFFS